MRFTDRYLKNLKPGTTRLEVLEGNGFAIRITPKGTISFIFVYQYRGRNRRLTLGQYPAVPLSEARMKHAAAKEVQARGLDPAAIAQEAQEQAKNALTVAELAKAYVEQWAKPRKRTWREDERMLHKDVVSRWGEHMAAEVKRRDILDMLDSLQDRGATITANRTLAVTRKMFNWAVERGIIEVSPCMGVRSPVPENQRDRVLTEEEIKAFWIGLDAASISPGVRLLLQLQLATAQRKGELVTALWAEFDLKGGWWTIPAAKAKNGMAHRVPISLLTQSLLAQVKALSGDSEWLFPSPRSGDKHIGPNSVDHALKRNLDRFGISPFTPHDLRRTAASLMTGMGISRLVVSKILNHVERGVTAIYDRHSYDQEKQMAMDKVGQAT